MPSNFNISFLGKTWEFLILLFFFVIIWTASILPPLLFHKPVELKAEPAIENTNKTSVSNKLEIKIQER